MDDKEMLAVTLKGLNRIWQIYLGETANREEKIRTVLMDTFNRLPNMEFTRTSEYGPIDQNARKETE